MLILVLPPLLGAAAAHPVVSATPGVLGAHALQTRKMGDMIIVDVHIEVDGNATVRQGHDIAFEAAKRVKAALPVLDVMTHLDPA